MNTLVSRFNYNHTTPIDGYIADSSNLGGFTPEGINYLEDYNPFMSFSE